MTNLVITSFLYLFFAVAGGLLIYKAVDTFIDIFKAIIK